MSSQAIGTALLLLGMFSLILGVSALVLYPAGITYLTAPVIHFIWLIFGIILVEKFAPVPTADISFSNYGRIIVAILFIFGLAASLQSGEVIARAVKIIEIIFQDLVIAALLTNVLKERSGRTTKIWLSVVFALLHTPLFFTQSFTNASAIVVGALFISYISISWFVQKKHDITAILVPHILFYLVFGTAFSLVFW